MKERHVTLAPRSPTLEDVARMLQEAERALTGCGEGLRFQVTPASGLRIVRRLPPVLNQPASYEAVVALETEPALWLIDRPEGRYCLLVPLGDPNSLASGPRGLTEVYFDGLPMPWQTAVLRPPLLDALYEMAAFLWHALPAPHQDAAGTLQ